MPAHTRCTSTLADDLPEYCGYSWLHCTAGNKSTCSRKQYRRMTRSDWSTSSHCWPELLIIADSRAHSMCFCWVAINVTGVLLALV